MARVRISDVTPQDGGLSARVTIGLRIVRRIVEGLESGRGRRRVAEVVSRR